MAGLIGSLISRLPRVVQDHGGAVVAALAMVPLVLGLDYGGAFQLLELKAWDGVVRLQADRGEDDRLLIVGITEEDIARFKVPLSDAVLAQLMQTLRIQGAHTIGLDLYRDSPVPPGFEALQREFQADHVVGIFRLPDVLTSCTSDPATCSANDAPSKTNVAPPPDLPSDQVGFNDLLFDPDDRVRRVLLFANPAEGQDASSFGFQVVRHYLRDRKLDPTFEPGDRLVWGQMDLLPLTPHAGGYQNQDSQGYQIFLDYRSPRSPAPVVSVSQVLNNEVPASLIQGRIVLIGSRSPSLNDRYATPFSIPHSGVQELYGVDLHAQIVSQLLDLVSGDRHPLRFPNLWLEALWLWVWIYGGTIVGQRLKHPLYFGLATIGSLGSLISLWAFSFFQRLWWPVVAPGVGWLLGLISLLAHSRYLMWYREQKLLEHLETQSQAMADLKTLIQSSSTSPPSDLTQPTTTLDLSQSLTITAIADPQPSTPTSRLDLHAGSILKDRYRITSILGRGGFGITYLAEDCQRPRSPQCVIKRLHPARRTPQFLETAKRLFKTEADVLETLGRLGDYVPQLLAYFDQDDELYLVQDYVPGHALKQELQPNKPLPPKQVTEILQGLLPTLDFIHRHHIIHRDVKPGNIIRRDDGRLILIDFGIVKSLPTLRSLEDSKTVPVGTLGYGAPEQMRGFPGLTSDIYALGVIGIQAWTGKPPQDLPVDVTTGEMLWSLLLPQGDPALIRILKRMTEFNPSDRYPSARSVLKDLDRLHY